MADVEKIAAELRERAEWRAANEGPFTKQNLVEWRAADELDRLREALEPFARADRAIGDEPGPFRFETERGYRLVEREHFRAAARALSTQVEERE